MKVNDLIGKHITFTSQKTVSVDDIFEIINDHFEGEFTEDELVDFLIDQKILTIEDFRDRIDVDPFYKESIKVLIENEKGEYLLGWGDDNRSPIFGEGEPFLYTEENCGDPFDEVELDIIWLKENCGIIAHGRGVNQNVYIG